MASATESSRAPQADQTVSVPGGTGPAPWWLRLWRDKVLVLFVVPGAAVLLIFHYLPLAGNAIAFQDYQPFLGIGRSDWVAWDNFEVMVNGDPRFLTALRNTLILTVLQAVLVFPAPIVLAVLMNSLFSERIKHLTQSILYLPHFLSWVIVVAVFQQMLGGSGLLNNMLRANDFATVSIIGNPDVFRLLLTSQVIWKDTGWATILFLAALSHISSEL
ncbi:MAG: sugar ABC transporter permease, partial [Propionibacteriales bacterium]|nr:sugar ABC transporter permease [Propionibacteriales bacterium]